MKIVSQGKKKLATDINCSKCDAWLQITIDDVEVDTFGKHVVCPNCGHCQPLKAKHLKEIGW